LTQVVYKSQVVTTQQKALCSFIEEVFDRFFFWSAAVNSLHSPFSNLYTEVRAFFCQKGFHFVDTC